MDGMKSFLDGFEKLAYDILVWLILVPKTLAKVISNPSWIPGYVTKELAEKDAARFDDYLSPVILMLLTSLVPFAIMDSFPERGLGVEGPIFGQAGEGYVFDAKADFIYPAPVGTKYVFSMTVEPYENQQDVSWGVSPIDGVVKSEDASGLFGVAWTEVGTYKVTIKAENNQGEIHIASHDIEIKSVGTAVDDSPMTFDVRETGDGGFKGLQDSLQGDKSILAALIFMGLPLVFALSIEMFRGRDISNSVLKRTFYAQCYCFAPLYLSMWSFALFLGYYWVEGINDLLMSLLLVVFLIVFVWFIVNEIRLIKRERAIGTTKATLIFLLCIFLGLATLVAYFDPESIFILWWSYLIAALFVFGTALFSKKAKDKTVDDETKLI